MLGFISLLLEALFALFIGYSVWWYVFRRPKNFPPGPKGLPLVGYIPFLTFNPGKKFVELEKKYGQIIGFDRGPIPAVMINDFNIMKKAFQDDAYTGKAYGSGATFLEGGESFAFHDDQKWHEGRRFAMATLRDFGLGKSSLEPKMLDELSYLITAIKDKNGKPFDLEELVSLSIGNINTIMQFNMRYDYDNELKKDLHHLLRDVFKKSTAIMLLVPIFPWLVNSGLYKYLPGYSIHKECIVKQERFLKKIIEDHEKSYYPGKKEDYIDAFLAEREERTKKNNHPEFFDDATLMTDIRMLSLAANETTGLTVSWIFIFLMAHPDIQAKIQAEIDQVIGRNRQPSMTDKPNMPYTEAFLLEADRRGIIFTFLDAKRVKKDTFLEGYFIPKDTHVFGNVWRSHFDEKLWPDPHTFRPERFIDQNGKIIKSNTEKLLTFSIGKRNCIGESLARMSIFLYTVTLLQNFTLVPPENELVTMESDDSFGMMAKSHKTRLIERAE